MTLQAWETRQRTGRLRRALAIVLTLAILVPLGTLFFSHDRDLREQRALTDLERNGIEYLVALSQLTIALTDAQAAAVDGTSIRGELLDRAVAAVTDVDDRHGEQLQVGERWSQLRSAIERAAGVDHATGLAAYGAYEETTSMLLGLHDRLRATAGLIRDPDPDAHYLQDAAGGSLPEATVALGQLVDLVTIADTEQGASAADISAAVVAAASPADALVAGIQAALDTTESRSLSSTLLGKYHRFLRAKDLLLGIVPPDGNLDGVDLDFLAAMRSELQTATGELATGLLTELSVLVEARASELARGERIALASVLAGLVLAIGLGVAGMIRDAHLPTRRAQPGDLPGGSGDDEPGAVGGSGRSVPELYPSQRSISDSATKYQFGSVSQAAGSGLAGEVLTAERADAR